MTSVEPGGRAVRRTAERLARAGFVAPEEEALDLVRAAPDEETLESWTARREHGEPLAWLTGAARFCGRTVLVDPGVYVPRPQSEELGRRASELLPGRGRAADLCTGSGAIAVHLTASAPHAFVVGVDIDRRAAACARRNGVVVVLGDLGSALGDRRFDLVTAIAPYVPTPALAFLPADVRRYEPEGALDGGPDGLDVVRRVVTCAGRLLRAGGWLVVELGGDQDRLVDTTLRSAGFDRIATWHDSEGDLRGLAAQWTRTTS